MHLTAGAVVGSHGRSEKGLNSVSLFQITITASDFRSLSFVLRNTETQPNQKSG